MLSDWKRGLPLSGPEGIAEVPVLLPGSLACS